VVVAGPPPPADRCSVTTSAFDQLSNSHARTSPTASLPVPLPDFWVPRWFVPLISGEEVVASVYACFSPSGEKVQCFPPSKLQLATTADEAIKAGAFRSRFNNTSTQEKSILVRYTARICARRHTSKAFESKIEDRRLVVELVAVAESLELERGWS
jgi:hypothetical protein